MQTITMSSDFPPSSPFLDQTTNEDFDPFAATQLTKNVGDADASKRLIIKSPFAVKEGSRVATPDAKEYQYPTPNPSSTTGARFSSPSRSEIRHEQGATSPLSHPDLENTESSPTGKQSGVEKGHKTQLDDLKDNALKIRLYSEQALNLGRSTRCDYFIKSKYASRNHLKVKYNADNNELIVLCKGHNGVVIELGREYYGYIKEVDENLYKFVKKNQDQVKNDEEKFKEFVVFKDEQIVIPYSDRIQLDIKGFKVMLDVINDDVSETEDELPVLHRDRMSSELSSIPDDFANEDETQPIEKVKTMEAPPSLVRSLSHTKELDIKPVEMPKPQRAKSLEPETISKGQSKESEEFRIPLAVKSESSLNQKQSQQPRRRKAEPGLSPQKKKIDHHQLTTTTSNSSITSTPSVTPLRKKYVDPREKIEKLNIDEILDKISKDHEIDSIKNVIINHLAFSRLSQTPLKQLQTVSQSIQALSRYQLRAVLASIGCIGVIYRHGKDAAGKPLDEEYYYDVEKDGDSERTKLVSSIKGSSGLRNCRKTHKQYFWKKPVTKK